MGYSSNSQNMSSVVCVCEMGGGRNYGLGGGAIHTRAAGLQGIREISGSGE